MPCSLFHGRNKDRKLLAAMGLLRILYVSEVRIECLFENVPKERVPSLDGLRACVSDVVAAVPLGHAAGVECLAVGDVVAATIITHPAVAAARGSGTPEGFILGVEAPGSTRERGSLNGDGAEQEGTDDDQGLVHVDFLVRREERTIIQVSTHDRCY
jgi:hypothetical protein